MKKLNRGCDRIARTTAILMVGLAAVACGSESSSSTTTTGPEATTATTGTVASGASKSVAEASKDELMVWQTDLNAVACYVGRVDGDLGPRTEAAIRAFQTAKGLTVDGKLGPQTEAALKQSVVQGIVVCKAAPDANATTKPVVKVSAADYHKSFTVTSCTSAGESDLQLEGTADSITLSVSVTDTKGTLTIAGGDEQDGVELSGDVTTLSVGDDGSIEAKGTFTGADMPGEEFTLVGTCP